MKPLCDWLSAALGSIWIPAWDCQLSRGTHPIFWCLLTEVEYIAKYRNFVLHYNHI